MSEAHEAAIEAAARSAFYVLSPVWGDDIPDEVADEGLDPDELYGEPISWDQWARYNNQLDTDSMNDMTADDIRKMVRKGVAAYQSAMAADVRAAVLDLTDATQNLSGPDLLPRLRAFTKAKYALLDLLGANEPTITEGETT
jgi:hypothetical protein